MGEVLLTMVTGMKELLGIRNFPHPPSIFASDSWSLERSCQIKETSNCKYSCSHFYFSGSSFLSMQDQLPISVNGILV